MSEFSDKCKELIQESGYTVYYLSVISDLDRTTLQRMITGKRLPGLDFILRFLDTLSVTQSDRESLLYLYDIEKFGSDYVIQRQIICDIIESLSYESDFDSLTNNLKSFCHNKNDSSKIISYTSGDVNVRNMVLESLYYEFSCNDTLCVNTNLPSNYSEFFSTLLYLVSVSSKSITLCHILTLLKNRMDSKATIYNLSTLKTALQCSLTPQLKYMPYFNYTNSISEMETFQPFPYYIITPRHTLWLSAKFNLAYRIENTEYASFLTGSLDNICNLKTLITCISDKNTALEHYQNTLKEKGAPSHILQACPPLWLLQAKLLPYENTTKYYCDMSGIIEFEQTGILSDLFTPDIASIPVLKRKQLLETFFNYAQTQNSNKILSPNNLKLSLYLHIHIFSNKEIIVYILKEQTLLSYIFINEGSICNAFYNFFNKLENDSSILVPDHINKST